MAICKIDDCERKHDAKGYCSMHYRRWKNNGSPYRSQKLKRSARTIFGVSYIPLDGTWKAENCTVVDYEDVWVCKYNWYKTKNGYAASRIKGKIVYLHNLLMQTPKGMDTDHINANKLDNRRDNLRVCTRSANMLNYHRNHKIKL